MKAVNYISILILLVLGSCSSGLYTGFEYDDLYYMPSDRPVTRIQSPVSRQIAEGDLKADEYYDNIFAADTLVSDEYSNAVDYDNAAVLDGKSGGTVNNYYYDDYSYSGRLRRFYGNYFNPYWRDPFYYSWGMPSMSFGYGYPYYSYDPFGYDPFYYGYGYNSFYYPRSYGFYGSFYSPFYSSYYWPYYNNRGYYSNIHYTRDYNNSIAYGRRERQSVYSTRWNSSVQPSASSRRDSYLSKGTPADGIRRSPSGSTSSVTTDTRKAVSTNVNNQQALNAADRKVDESASKSTTTRSTTVSKPEYNTVNRTYTPSYSNPRMSTRPSYNNSRVNSESSGSNSYRSTVRTSPSVSAGQTRSVPSYNNSGSYSSPSRRSSSGSSSSGSSGSSSSRSSYSSGSSGGGSRSSYSSGSSSSGSSSSSSSSGSSRSSSSGSSSGGRR
ncbi:MAG: hypothetical protein A2V50_07230 [Bacteroidetes bacterium RBG_19FT_COMBO_42_10]|nr:MAG: hypothetical protein A2V50_07230 [Bacteroidetes bacterium RBG_19FT_COMBO_42_10]